MKKVLTIVLFVVLLIIPFRVNALEFGYLNVDKELINSTDNGNETTTYEYAISVYSIDGEFVNQLAFTITHKTNYLGDNFEPVNLRLDSIDVISEPNDEETIYSYMLSSEYDDLRLYGGSNNQIGVYTITLSNGINPDDAIELGFAGCAGYSAYMDENEYSLTISDVNDIGEYTIDILVGSLVFDFNENFDGTFTWEPHSESGIKINNLSNKGIRVLFDFDSNVRDLTLGGNVSIRQSVSNWSDCLGYYAVTEQDHSLVPNDWKSTTYDNTGLFARTYFTDSECTVPLENGSEFDETKEYYFVDNFDSRGFPEDFQVVGYIFDIDAYDQNEYSYPGLDFDFELEGGTLDDVQRIQRGNKKIGTITLTIVGV